MRAIFKYPFDTTGGFTLDLPSGAEILSLQVQRSTPCLWALVDSAAEPEARWFRVLGTGHPVPDDFEGKFLGTYQLASGSLVFHVFEVAEPVT